MQFLSSPESHQEFKHVRNFGDFMATKSCDFEITARSASKIASSSVHDKNRLCKRALTENNISSFQENELSRINIIYFFTIWIVKLLSLIRVNLTAGREWINKRTRND